MSDRHNKGSSRSTRDDSRTYKERGGRDRRRSRSRSRSPRKRPSPPLRGSEYSPPRGYSPSRGHSPSRSSRSSHSKDRETHHEDRKSEKYMSNDWEDSEEEVPAPPPPPRITKISIGFSKPKDPIKMTLGGGSKASASSKKPVTVASVFNDDDDDEEPEEMPAEARMRMRNIGRETPTSAGPNSFGKTKQGFCDAKKVFEKNLKQALETNAEKPAGKFPQTIYKIKGP